MEKFGIGVAVKSKNFAHQLVWHAKSVIDAPVFALYFNCRVIVPVTFSSLLSCIEF